MAKNLVKEYYADYVCDNGRMFFDSNNGVKIESDNVEDLVLPMNCALAEIYMKLVTYVDYEGKKVRMTSDEKIHLKNLCIGSVQSRVKDPVTKEVEHAVLTNRGRRVRVDNYDNNVDIVIYPDQVDKDGKVHLENTHLV